MSETVDIGPLDVKYGGESYVLDMEDMDTDEARAMERYGIPDLRTLQEGIQNGKLDCLTFSFWLARRQNGEDGARLDKTTVRPVKWLNALTRASDAALKAAEAKAAEGKAGEPGEG
jgi:hypothetical protein